MSQEELKYTGMMQTALQFINSTGRHIFLTGKAGTGKTTFLRSLQSRTHKQLAVVAPTGIAALNAGGTTIHSQFLFPFGMFIPDKNYAEPSQEKMGWYTENSLIKRHPLNSQRLQVLRSIDLLVIDEVSMLRADLLDAIDARMRMARSNHRQSFGGVQLLLIGDLYQLPPVVKREEDRLLNQFYQSPWFFESYALKRDGFTYIELDKIFRQSDNDFINVLNNLRVNKPTREDLTFLNRFYKSEDEIQKLTEVITLTTHNYKADEMNAKALAQLDDKSHFFSAGVKDDFPEQIYPVLTKLELKVGAQVMFTRNDSEDGIYYNGKLATVTAINGVNITVSLAGTNRQYTLKRVVWENKKYKVNTETKDLEEDVVGTFEQYPVKLAWAITVHKSQGLTFEKAIIDVGQAFADGQVYVALSRLRSIDGLILRTKVDPSIVSTDRNVVSFDVQNNRPHELDDVIKVSQKAYMLEQCMRAFDFGAILKAIDRVNKGDEDNSTVLDDETMKPVLRRVSEAFTAQLSNTHRFREQLTNLYQSGNFDEFLTRLQKGQEYYIALLWEQVQMVAQHIEDIKAQKVRQSYGTRLGDLEQLLMKKLEDADNVVHLSEVILGKIDNFDFTSIGEARRIKRNSLIASVEKKENPKVKKKKRSKKDPGTPTTFEVSMVMVEQGMSLDEIAETRDLTRGTIENHLAKGIETGRISISAVMTKEEVDEISNAYYTMTEGYTSADVFHALKGKYSYGQLKAVRAHNEFSKKS
jgi:hypothetical protein